MHDGGETRSSVVQQAAVLRAIALLFPNHGPALLRHGVRERRGSDVSDTAVRKIQGTGSSVSFVVSTIRRNSSLSQNR